MNSPAQDERYDGELGSLRWLCKVIIDLCPDEELLSARCRRALASNSLELLRGARTAWNRYPLAYRSGKLKAAYSQPDVWS